MYRIVRNDGMGNCLFYAMAQGIIHKKNLSDDYKTLGKTLRRNAIDYMKQRSEKDETYKMLISVMYPYGNPDKDCSQQYIQWMSKNTSWGGDIEIKAIEKYLHKIGISGARIHYADVEKGFQRSLKVINGFGTNIRKNKHPTIKLILHHAQTGGSHYEYIYKVKNLKRKKCSVSNGV
jgi:hypothetical protein